MTFLLSQVDGIIPHGLNVLTTCVFIVGVIAGAGFLTLPKAVEDAGYTFIHLYLHHCESKHIIKKRKPRP